MSSTTTETTGKRHRPYFWEEFTTAQAARPQGEGESSLPAWADRGLRALRDGLGCEPGGVPAMRFLHRVEVTDADWATGLLPSSYRAEHAALTLFGLHQTGSAQPVHRPGVGLGTACQGLSTVLSQSAVRRRLAAAATAHDLDELVQHLRGIIPLLRQADTGLDYTRLHRDLGDWLTPRHGRVLRAWGLQFTDPPAAEPIAVPRPATEPMAGKAPGRAIGARYWTGFDPQAADAGAALAALRSGLGQEAGTVPAMWFFYRTAMGTPLRAKGALTRDLVAEHAALTLFGVHQHGRHTVMHVAGASPGTACRVLLAKDSPADRTSTERRLGALLTSQDGEELAHHLRGLVTLLRRKDIGLDYDALRTALRYWDDPSRPQDQPLLRNRWDRDFRAGTTGPAQG